jgi:hypothetical protein
MVLFREASAAINPAITKPLIARRTVGRDAPIKAAIPRSDFASEPPRFSSWSMMANLTLSRVLASSVFAA